MSAPKDGGPAFPVAGEALPTHMGYALSLRGGLTLRDYFAGQALEGILAHPETKNDPRVIAHAAYSMADAMIAARSTGRPE